MIAGGLDLVGELLIGPTDREGVADAFGGLQGDISQFRMHRAKWARAGVCWVLDC